MPAGAGNDYRACYSLDLAFSIMLKSKTYCPTPRKRSLRWRDDSISSALFLCPLIFRLDSSLWLSVKAPLQLWNPGTWDVSQTFAAADDALSFSSSLIALLLLQCVLQHGLSARSPLTVKKKKWITTYCSFCFTHFVIFSDYSFIQISEQISMVRCQNISPNAWLSWLLQFPFWDVLTGNNDDGGLKTNDSLSENGDLFEFLELVGEL